jgi:hypothetical protein
MAFPRVTRDHLLFAACGGVFVIFLQQLALYIRPKIESETSARNRSQNDEKVSASSASKATEKKKVQGSEPETGFAEKFLKGKSLSISIERIKLRFSIFKFQGVIELNHSSFTHKFHAIMILLVPQLYSPIYNKTAYQDATSKPQQLSPASEKFDELGAYKKSIGKLEPSTSVPPLDLSTESESLESALKGKHGVLVGFGNNEDGQLSPHIGKLSTIDPGNQPGLSPRIVSQKLDINVEIQPETFSLPTPLKHLSNTYVVKGVSCG